MTKNNIPGDKTEERVKDYFRSQAERQRAPADLWAKLEPRLKPPSGEGWWAGLWRRLAVPGQWPLVPATAGVVALVLVVAGAWLLTGGPQEVDRLAAPPAYPAVTPMPVPAPMPPTGPRGPEGAKGAEVLPGGPALPRGAGFPVPTPTPLPMPTPVPRAVPAPTPAPAPPPAPPLTKEGAAGATGDASSLGDQTWAAQRMVIRNGTLSLVVADTAKAIDQASRQAKDMGGYVVSSRMWQEGKRVAGSIAIRVPAELFADAVRALKAMAIEVVAEDTSSQDVTEEYVDLSSRLRSLEATETQLLQLMKTATKVEDVLAVQRELARVQKELEQTKGRMKYLEQSSATSVIQVTLREVGLDIGLSASTRKARVGEEVRFTVRASGGFPPYSYRWDLGDGTISTEEAPSHAYARVGKLDISLTVTDSKGNTATETRKEFIAVEAMEAFLDVSATEVKVGEQVFFTSKVAGGFTPYSYQWDLGDGTASTERNPRHAYQKAGRYTVSLTITDDKGNADTETKSKLMTVTAPPGWSAGKEVQAALRALSTLGRWLVVGLIWVAVFVPLWGLVTAAIVAVLVRWRR